MSARSVHEAAVEAVRLVVHEDFGGKIGYCYHETDCPEPGQYYRRCEPTAQRIVAALVASAEVRKGLAEDFADVIAPGDDGTWAADRFLAALAGTENDNERSST